MSNTSNDSAQQIEKLQKAIDVHQRQVSSLQVELDAVRMQKIELEHRLERTALRRRGLENLLSLHAKTGLPTHFRLKNELDEVLRHLDSSGETVPLSILILNLDNTINTLQRTTKASISEWVLYQLGNRFIDTLDERDQVFHTRDSEFVFLLYDPQDDELFRKIKKIFQRLREPFVFSNIKVTLDGWAGVSLYPEHGVTRSILLRHADIALNAASEQKRNIVIFQEQLMNQVIEKIDLQNSIIRAIEAPAMQNISQQFSLHYQPKLYVYRNDSNDLYMQHLEAEVLMRWNHPEKGAIGPDRFIPLAEETGLIMPMGKWVLYTAANQLTAWAAEGINDIPLSINLSARQLKNDDIIEITRNLVSNRGIRPHQLVFELTETSIFEDPQCARRLMEALHEIGVRISIDDFGTGYSSLSYLSRFPVHEIKVDRSFICRFLNSPTDKAIIRSITHLAEQMQWNIVAEGVESLEEVHCLIDMGIRCFQGYYFCRPSPPEEFAEYVHSLRADDSLPSGQLSSKLV